MKKIILCLVLSWMSLMVLGQENFEGRIIQTINISLIPQIDTAELFFGRQFIKITSKENFTKNLMGDMIIDFEKGIKFNLNTKSKTYTIDTINEFYGKSIYEAKMIQSGIKAKKIGVAVSSFKFVDSLKKGDTINNNFWYADSLFYKIPKKYFNLPECLFFTNGEKVLVEMKVNIGEDNLFLDLKPVLIESIKLSDSIFKIPNDYVLDTLRKNDYPFQTETKITDSQMNEVKGNPPPPPPPSKPPKYNSKAPKKKAVSKTKK